MHIIEHNRYQLSSVLCLWVLGLNNGDCRDTSMGNGTEESGDGWKFRGRGALQLTGKDNYKAFADYLDKPEIMDNPDLVATTYSFESAFFFFDKNKLWAICDLGINDPAIEKLTRKINGGTHGLDDRNAKTKKYYEYVK